MWVVPSGDARGKRKERRDGGREYGETGDGVERLSLSGGVGGERCYLCERESGGGKEGARGNLN